MTSNVGGFIIASVRPSIKRELVQVFISWSKLRAPCHSAQPAADQPLERLDLFGCTKLRLPPDVSTLTEHLQILNCIGCESLEALPDVSGLGGLRALVEPAHLKT